VPSFLARSTESSAALTVPQRRLPTMRRLYYGLAATISLAVTVYYGIALGQDSNWDQRNYHIAIPFLLLHGTFWDSIAPSGIQSFFNPVILVAQYLLLSNLPPIVAAFTLASVQSFAFVIAAAICLQIAWRDGSLSDFATAFLGFILCLLSPMALSEAGGTFPDLITAVPVLLAYLLLLLARKEAGSATHAQYLLAGALLGLAAGLKLTNAVFALGAMGFFMAGSDTPWRRVSGLLLLIAGCGVGFVVIAGWWHMILWQRFGNPVFPYYNNIFHSPDFAPVALFDGRFLPRSNWDVFGYPLYWLFGGSPDPAIGSPSSEVPLRDARFALVVFGSAAFLLSVLMRGPAAIARVFACPVTGLFVTAVLAYLIWLSTFGYHRYMIALEILCGVLILYLVGWIRWPALRHSLLLACVLLASLTISVPNWGRLPWKHHWQGLPGAHLDFGGPSLVFLARKPTAFVAASLPADTRYVGLYEFDLHSSSRSLMTDQLKTDLAGGNYLHLKALLRGPLSQGSAEVLQSYGLNVSDRCVPLQVADENLNLCDLERTHN
jgi:hypothetical protein